MAANAVRVNLAKYGGTFFSRLIMLMFPPKDLYFPLATLDVDVGLPGGRVEMPITHKYPGAHECNMTFERGTIQKYAENPILKVNLVMKRDEQILKHWCISPQLSFPGGYALIKYVVPFDVPLDEGLSLVFEVERADPELSLRCGKARIVLKKSAEI